MSGFRAPAAVAIVQHNQKLVDDPGDGEISEAPGSAHARLRGPCGICTVIAICRQFHKQVRDK